MSSEALAVANPKLDEASHPILPRYARMHFDKTRDRWMLLVPERVMVPDETAIEILELCDGVRSLGDIIDHLAQKFVAEREAIAGDVISMLQDLADKGFLIDATVED